VKSIGVVGLGFIGNVHLSCFQQMEGIRIGGVADEVRERGEKSSKYYGCKLYEDCSQLIRADDVDIIDICVPTYLHKQLAVATAKEGKDIICEKPIARTIIDAKEMAQASRENNVRLFIGHVVRFFPEYAKIRECIRAGEVGKPGMVRTFRGGASPLSRASWYNDVGKSGGLLVDMLIHDFDWLRWTFGEIKSVYAQGSSLKEKEVVLVNVRFKNGIIAHVEGSWAHPANFPFTTRVEVTGTQGLIQYDSNNSAPVKVFSEKAGEATKAPESPLSKSPWCLELEHFIECLRKNEKPLVTIDDAIEALRISMVALCSLKEKRPVLVSDLDEC